MADGVGADDALLAWSLGVIGLGVTGLVGYKHRPDWAEVVARVILARHLTLLIALLQGMPALPSHRGLNGRQLDALAQLDPSKPPQVQASLERNLLVRRGLPPLVNTIVKVLLFVAAPGSGWSCPS